MTQIPPKINVSKLTPAKLKLMIKRYNDAGYHDHATECLRELDSRGAAKAEDYEFLEWNQGAVRRAMEPFVAVAASVPENKRTPYTEAGGTRIGRSKADPEWNWIDTYSAIKRGGINICFVCYIKHAGAEPRFVLLSDGEQIATCGSEDMPGMLARWTALAEQARSAT